MKTRVCHACSSVGTENLLITNNIWENSDYPDNSTTRYLECKNYLSKTFNTNDVITEFWMSC